MNNQIATQSQPNHATDEVKHTHTFQSHHQISPARAHLIINIILTILCTLALCGGIAKAIYHGDIYNFRDFYQSAIICTTTFLAYTMKFAMKIFYHLFHIDSNSFAFISSAFFLVLFFALLVNAGYAIYYFTSNYQQNPRYATRLLIFALVPALFILALVVIPLFFF